MTPRSAARQQKRERGTFGDILLLSLSLSPFLIIVLIHTHVYITFFLFFFFFSTKHLLLFFLFFFSCAKFGFVDTREITTLLRSTFFFGKSAASSSFIITAHRSPNTHKLTRAAHTQSCLFFILFILLLKLLLKWRFCDSSIPRALGTAA